jgi:hypothetical protein
MLRPPRSADGERDPDRRERDAQCVVWMGEGPEADAHVPQ